MDNLKTILAQISEQIDGSITASIHFGEDTYTIADSIVFNQAVSDFRNLYINDTHPNYLEYNELKIKIGNILADIKDKPSLQVNMVLKDYNLDINTLQFAEKYYGSLDSIKDMYLANAVNTDFELLSFGKVLILDI